MPTSIILLALCAALLHASWNATIKSVGSNPLFNITTYRAVCGLFCLPLLPFVTLPENPAWLIMAGSIAVHNVYYFALSHTYASGDFSQVYALFRGCAPLLIALAAIPVAGEWLSVSQQLGILIICLGIISLALPRNKLARPSGMALAWGFVTALCIAVYTLADGIGARTVDDPLSFIVWLFALEALPTLLYLLVFQRSAWLQHLGNHKLPMLAGGLASGAAYALVIYTMSIGSLALVSALRETSVLFAALIGAFVLKEPFGKQRIIAACIVVIGVIIIHY